MNEIDWKKVYMNAPIDESGDIPDKWKGEEWEGAIEPYRPGVEIIDGELVTYHMYVNRLLDEGDPLSVESVLALGLERAKSEYGVTPLVWVRKDDPEFAEIRYTLIGVRE